MLKVGNAQGFWGDRVGAASQLAKEQPDIDYITLDYLAEVTLSLLALQKERLPQQGYAVDFIEELRLMIPLWENGSNVKIVANAGGLNPLACAKAAAEALKTTSKK